MTAQLRLDESAYTLSQERGGLRVELAVLERHAFALSARPGTTSEAALEDAIEVAEDWLQPHAKALKGEQLEVQDTAGRLRFGLKLLSCADERWTLEQMERLFVQIVDRVTGRTTHTDPLPGCAFLADMVLLRELAHHAQLAEVRLV